jgi:hypothetical protein
VPSSSEPAPVGATATPFPHCLRHLVFGVFVGWGFGPLGAGWSHLIGTVFGVGLMISRFGCPGGMSTGVFPGMSYLTSPVPVWRVRSRRPRSG